MKERRKSLYVFLVIALLLNLVFPPTMVSAFDGLLDDSSNSPAQSVTDATYGNAPSVTKATYGSITENIIKEVKIRELKGNVPGQDITKIRPDINSRVQVDFKFELKAGHSYGDGSTFTFHLPPQLKLTLDEEKTGVLDGDIGTYRVTKDGEITFTFNDSINGGQSLDDGYFFVWVEFDKGKMSGGTKQEIEFTFNGEIEKILVNFKPSSNSDIGKEGHPNKNKNPDSIEWTVDFNKSENKIEKAVFVDQLPVGLTVYGDIEVYKLEVQLDGSTKVLERVTNYREQVEKNKITLEFDSALNEAYRVKYRTKIDNKKNESYENIATVTGSNSKDLRAQGNVSVTFGHKLAKIAGAYDSYKQTIGWTIQFNYMEDEIKQSDAWIEDYFDGSVQEIVDMQDTVKVYPVTFDDRGNPIRSAQPLDKGKYSVSKFDITKDNTAYTGFKISFPDKINGAYDIEYATKLKNRVEKSVTAKNYVDMHDVQGVTGSKTVSQSIFFKRGDMTDYKDKTIKWTLTLNSDRQLMNHVIVEDDFSGQGLTYRAGTLKVYRVVNGNRELLAPHTDYTIDDKFNEGKFAVRFINPITEQHIIEYDTKFDPTLEKRKDSDGKDKYFYKNNAKLKWIVGTDNKELPGGATVIPNEYTQDNGNKKGSYNAKTKRIEWTIDVNYNLHKISNAIIDDFYSNGQKYVQDSLVIKPLEIKSDGSFTLGNEVSKDKYELDTNIQKDGRKGLQITFKNDIHEAYQITYQTEIEDNEIVKSEYFNQASLYNAQKSYFTKSAKVFAPNGDKFVEKTGLQTGDYALWAVTINRSQSYIKKGSVLTDTLSEGQVLIKDTVEIFHAEITNAEGNAKKLSDKPVDKNDYKVEVEGNLLTITFNKDLTTPYVLEYKSFITADNGDKLNNKVSFKGHSAKEVEQESKVEFVVKLSGAGGGASSGKGDLKVIKEDAETGKVLSGAVFELSDKNTGTLLGTVSSNDAGIAEFKQLRYKREYILKEVTAPSGYVLADGYKDGVVISFQSITDPIIVKNAKGVWDVELSKVDAKDRTKYLEGAVFTLQYKEGTEYKVVGEYTTDSKGKIYIPKLKSGDYRLLETKAPKFYKLNPKWSQEFTIIPNQTKKIEITVENIEVIGSVELLKLDEDHRTPVADAKFELQDENGKVLHTDLQTNQEGKLLVENLSGGSYQFVEVAAPAGYALNTEPLKFEILDEGKKEVIFTNKELPGSVKLIKIAYENKEKKLSGAKFRLLDAEKQPVKDEAGAELPILTTDTNGEASLPALKPGKYFFEETEAPSGYIRNTTWSGFEITRGQLTVVTVENVRYTDGGGGGKTDPYEPWEPSKPGDKTPPKTDPNIPTIPGQIVDPIVPKTPTTPTTPGTTTDPDQPMLPGETTDPDTGNTTEPGGIKGNPDGDKDDEGNPDDADLGGKTVSKKPNPKPGGKLPQTGEEAPVSPIVGMILITAAVLMWIARKRLFVRR